MANQQLFPGEHIYKKEDKLRFCKGIFNIKSGTLVLTMNELYFLASFQDKKAFSVPTANIISVNCKKGIGTGNENMYVLYKDGQKEKKIKIQHSSFMSFATVGNLSRIGGFYFSSWERAINEIREGRWPRGGDGIDDIKKLARLRDQGILTEEEFSAKKKQLLGI